MFLSRSHLPFPFYWYLALQTFCLSARRILDDLNADLELLNDGHFTELECMEFLAEYQRQTKQLRFTAEKRLRERHVVMARSCEDAWKLFQRLKNPVQDVPVDIATLREHFSEVYFTPASPCFIVYPDPVCFH